ncbi:MAG: GAF domain-containing protein, partial [Woeseiaceae bacterium]
VGLLFIFRGDLEIIADESQIEVQQHRWAAALSTEVGDLDNEQKVLSHVLDAVRLRFELLSAQVYLVDEAGTFTRMMRAGGSEIEMIRREGLGLGEANIINEALRAKEARTTSSDDPLPRRSHLLTAATFGCAIPIRQGDETLGVLDVQKAGLTPFTAREIRVLSMAVDQLAIALRRSQQISDLERNLREREAANQHLQTQASNYQQRERQAVVGSWTDYLDGQGKSAIGYSMGTDGILSLIPAGDLPGTLHNTLSSATLQVETVDDERIINVPIVFRDQTLGAMSFAIPKDQELSERQVEMARIVAERLALALENTRLFEQSQAQALRERKASEINSVLIGATDVRSVLSLAAENFNEALGAIHTRIYIQPEALAEPLAEAENGEL